MPEERDEGGIPPIPDGGLSESMPEWLRRPPAWRTLSDAEVVQPEPTRASELPEADTSVIDPRTFLTDDDLPEWLRRMGPGRQRVRLDHSDDEAPVAAADSRSDTSSHGTSPGDGAPQGDLTPARPPARFVPRTPAAPNSPASPKQRESATRTTVAGTGSSGGASTPWWRGTPMILLLAVMLVVAIAVIIGMLGA